MSRLTTAKGLPSPRWAVDPCVWAFCNALIFNFLSRVDRRSVERKRSVAALPANFLYRSLPGGFAELFFQLLLCRGLAFHGGGFGFRRGGFTPRYHPQVLIQHDP